MSDSEMAKSGPPDEEDLNKAIEELRGVLREDGSPIADAPPPPRRGWAASSNQSIVMDIPVDVQIVLGSTEMSVSDLMALQKGSTVALDRRIGEPVDVVVNGRTIASGEITVLDDDPTRFGIVLTHIAESRKLA